MSRIISLAEISLSQNVLESQEENQNSTRSKITAETDFEKMRDALSVIAERTRLGNITETSLKKNLTQFRKEIKTYKEKTKISTADNTFLFARP